MDTVLTIVIALLVSLGSIAIALNVSHSAFKSIFEKSTKAISLIKMISKDISDDPHAEIIASTVLEGLDYVIRKYEGADKETLIYAGVCYTEELLVRMGIEVDDRREELVHEIFVIAYDIIYGQK